MELREALKNYLVYLRLCNDNQSRSYSEDDYDDSTNTELGKLLEREVIVKELEQILLDN